MKIRINNDAHVELPVAGTALKEGKLYQRKGFYGCLYLKMATNRLALITSTMMVVVPTTDYPAEDFELCPPGTTITLTQE